MNSTTLKKEIAALEAKLKELKELEKTISPRMEEILPPIELTGMTVREAMALHSFVYRIAGNPRHSLRRVFTQLDRLASSHLSRAEKNKACGTQVISVTRPDSDVYFRNLSDHSADARLGEDPPINFESAQG